MRGGDGARTCRHRVGSILSRTATDPQGWIKNRRSRDAEPEPNQAATGRRGIDLEPPAAGFGAGAGDVEAEPGRATIAPAAEAGPQRDARPLVRHLERRHRPFRVV